jgi:hypothetical protein
MTTEDGINCWADERLLKKVYVSENSRYLLSSGENSSFSRNT